MCPKTRWRDLKREKATIFKDKVIEGDENIFLFLFEKEGDWKFERETTAMWNQMVNCIRKVAKEVLR